MRARRRLAACALGLGLGLTLAAGGLALLGRLDPAPLPPARAWGTRILAADGTVLALSPAAGGVWRFETSPRAVSPFLIRLLITVEDRNFRREPGVDPLAILRAAGQWIAAGHVVSGGSTLTMQTAKLLDPRPRTIAAKVLETARAFDLWRRLTPDQILGLWLSSAPFGGNLVGVEAASYAWFGKPPGALDAAEAALLVALPRRPEALRPDRHPAAAERLRNRILALAAARGLLTPAEARSAEAEPVPRRRQPMPRALPQLFADIRHPPLLRTTLDAGLQGAVTDAAEAALLAFPPKTALTIMVTDAESGAIRALWLGQWNDTARAGRSDLSRALRSPGSTLKPFLYALAFANGLAAPDSLLADSPRHFGAYGPEDFTGRFAGRVTARDALRRSLNLPAVGLLARYGALRFAADLAASGTPLHLPPGSEPSLPIILGGAGLSMRALMGLYDAIASDATVRPPWLVQGAAPPRQVRLLSPEAAAMVADILTRPFPTDLTLQGIAWKTGTSAGNRDDWAFGFDRRHVIGVWVGRPDGTPMGSGEAADRALPILARLFSLLPPAPRRRAPPAAMLSLAAAPAADPLRLLFPPPGAVIEGLGTLDLKAMGGERPLRFLIDGAPLTSIPALRETEWQPPGPGFYTVEVLDATGAAARVAIRVSGGG
ncbi:penicillin-binding protein 1C [Acidisoma sp. C75]